MAQLEQVDWQKQLLSLVEAQRAQLVKELNVLRAELDRSHAETKSLKAQVQRLTRELRTTRPQGSRMQFPPGISSHTRLHWRRGADAPEPFNGARAVVMGESVYIGGDVLGTEGCSIFQYSWRRGVWSTIPKCPLMAFGLTVFMGRLTTVGGEDSEGSETGHVYQFVTQSQQWQESLPPMPTARCYATVVARLSSSFKPPAIAVCGGTYDNEPVNTVEVFCHSSSQWYTAEPLPIPSCSMTSATVGNITYFLGGSCICHGEAKHCFSVSLDSLIDTSASPAASPSQHGPLWTRVSDIPVSSCAVSLRGSLLAVGGNLIDHSEVYQPRIHFLTSSGSWESLGGDLAELTMCTAVCLPSGELMVVGGFNPTLCDSCAGSASGILLIASIAD